MKQSSSKHCLSVLNQLNQQRLSNQFCDVTLLIEGEEYKAHKSVLAANSEYFRELFIEKGAVTSHEAVVDLSGELLWVSKIEIIISEVRCTVFDSVSFECSRQPNILSCFFSSFNLKVFCMVFHAKMITLVFAQFDLPYWIDHGIPSHNFWEALDLFIYFSLIRCVFSLY